MARNMTSSAERVGWVSSGDGRSTSNILWSCFSVFLVCTWSCLHLNVPSIEESEAGWLKWHGVPYWPERPLLNKWTRKVSWMMFIVIAPEFGVALAMEDYLKAHKLLAECHSLVDETDDEKAIRTAECGDTRTQLTVSHAFCANMGGFKVKIWSASTNEAMDSPAMRLYEGNLSNYEQLEYLTNVCPNMQIPTEEDIKDLSKRDAFTKTFACVQSLWLVIQCITRAAEGLPITQLELATIAFVVCGILMYLLWWNKPFGIERKQPLVATLDHRLRYVNAKDTELEFPEINRSFKRLSLRTSTHDLDLQGTRENRKSESAPLKFLEISGIDDYKPIVRAIYAAILRCLSSSSTEPVYPSPLAGASAACYVSGTLFSAFHVLAWNWDFPSPSIRIAWRVFAVVATCANPVFIFLVFMDDVISNYDFHTPLSFPIIGSLGVYFLARLGLIVLIFYCFYSMPVGVYHTVEWTKFWPHFS